MANYFQTYMQGQQLGMQQGQNALAMGKMLQDQRRQEQMRNILSQAYRPSQAAIPAMGEAPALGPVRPGETLPDYPAQAGRAATPAQFDVSQARAGLLGKGFIPEAVQLTKLAGEGGPRIGTYNPRDYTPESWTQFTQTKDPSVLNRYETSILERLAARPDTAARVAETQAQISGEKARAAEEAKTGVQLAMKPKIQRAVKQAEIEAKAKGETFTDLVKAKASLPGLKEVVGKLGDLSGMATYTTSGKIFDIAAKELGFGATEGSTARAKMQSLVDNQVLPLLRQTFGAAFTKEEGDRLRATMLDIDAAPDQKQATLDAFIEQKVRDIEAKEIELKQYDQPTGAPKAGSIQGGYVFIGGDPADSKNWRKQ